MRAALAGMRAARIRIHDATRLNGRSCDGRVNESRDSGDVVLGANPDASGPGAFHAALPAGKPICLFCVQHAEDDMFVTTAPIALAAMTTRRGPALGTGSPTRAMVR